MNTKQKVKDYIVSAVALTAFFSIILIVISLCTVPKTPTTVEQVRDVIASHGYTPLDIAEIYHESQPDSKSTLKEGVGFQDGDIHFDFYVFYNLGTPERIFAEARSMLIDKYHARGKKNDITAVANYTIFTLREKETYNIVVCVENTLVYAYCNEKNEGKINKILREIDYLK